MPSLPSQSGEPGYAASTDPVVPSPAVLHAPLLPLRGGVRLAHPALSPQPGAVAAESLFLVNNSLVSGNPSYPNALSPGASAYDSKDGQVAITDTDQSLLIDFDPVTHRVVKWVPLTLSSEFGVDGIAYLPGTDEYLLVAAFSSQATLLNASTLAEVSTVNLSAGQAGLFAAYNPSNQMVYVLDGAGDIQVLNLTKKAVQTVITLHENGYGMAFDPSLGLAFMTDPANGNVSIIDTTSNGFLVNVAVGSYPTGVAYSPYTQKVYVVDSGSQNVSVIDPSSRTVVGQFALPPNSGSAAGAWASPSANRLLLTDVPALRVSEFNETTGSLLASNYSGWAPGNPVYVASSGDVLVPNGASDNVSLFATPSLALVANVTLGTGPVDPMLDPANGLIFVPDYAASGVYTINPTTDHVVGHIEVGAAPEAVAYDPADNTLVVACTLNGSVAFLNATTGLFLSRLSLPGGPSSPVYDPATHRVYVALSESGGIATVDVTNRTASSWSVSIRGYVTSLVLDPTRGRLYAGSIDVLDAFAGGFPGNVTVLATGNESIVSVIDLPSGVNDVAYVPSTDTIWTADVFNNSVSVINAATLTRTTSFPLGIGPTTLLYDAGANEVLVADEFSRNVSIVNATTHALVATSPSGFGGSGLLEVSGQVVVTNEFDGSVTFGYAESAGGPSISEFVASPSALYTNNGTNLSVVIAGTSAGLTFRYSGLPPGCASANVSTLVCIPTASGSYLVEVNVTDPAGRSAIAFTPLSVFTVPSIVGYSATPAQFTLGRSTTLSVTVAGGAGWVSLSYSGLPPGCGSSNTTALTCTPSQAGTSTVTATATDGFGTVAVAQLSFTANALPAVRSFTVNPSPATSGGSIHLAVSTTGGTAPLSYFYSGLPAGCSSQNLSSFDCVPAATGYFSIVVNVTDADGFHGAAEFNLTVASPAPAPSTIFGLPLVAFAGLIVAIAVVAAAVGLLALRRRRARASSAGAPAGSGSGAPPPEAPDAGSGLLFEEVPSVPAGAPAPARQAVAEAPPVLPEVEEETPPAAPVPPPAPVPGARRMVRCAHCGRENEPWLSFCRYCKRTLESTS